MLLTIKAHPKSKELKFLWKDEVDCGHGGKQSFPTRNNKSCCRHSSAITGRTKILHAYLTEPADKNKANLQLIRELSKRFGSCKLVKGAASSKKLVEV